MLYLLSYKALFIELLIVIVLGKCRLKFDNLGFHNASSDVEAF